MAGATATRKSYPGQTSESWFPLRVGGHASVSLTGIIIDTVILPFDCIIRQVYLSVTEQAAGATNLTLATIDGTLTIVTTIAAVVDAAAVLQTLASTIDGVELNTGDKVQTKITTDADSITNFQWTLFLESIR